MGLFGRLGDARAVPVLVPQLGDPDLGTGIPGVLASLGDPRAIPPLIDVLDDDDPSMHVSAIYALEDLRAREALPRLRALLGDQQRTRFGNEVRVADAARVAIAKIE